MKNFKEKYGSTALVAGASEGLGFAFANALAAQGFNLILVARRKDVLEKASREISEKYKVNVLPLAIDLGNEDAARTITSAIGDTEIDILIYNAALAPIGPFLNLCEEELMKVSTVNMNTPIKLLKILGEKMIERKRGGIVLMTSLAGMQGSGNLSMYSATKAFNLLLGESLWYEWKNKGVDVIACCAGATSTPGYINSQPKKASMFAPKVQPPDAVVQECFKRLGKSPSVISGAGNKLASFFMHKILSRKTATEIMGKTTEKIYSDKL